MNRLILIGNGFDLAHGLKTGYNDFLLWYLKDVFERAKNNQFYEDPLLKVRKHWQNDLWHNLLIPTVDEFITAYYEQGFANLIANKGLTYRGRAFDPPFAVEVKSAFFEHLLVNCSRGKWVHIEK